MMRGVSSPRSFEVLLAVSRELDDDFIDEDISDVQRASEDRTVSNRTITVRGKRRGRAVVLCYQDYYSNNIDPRAPSIYEHQVLEVFAAQPSVSFEGACRRRGGLDRAARWVGLGGATGPHPIFERLRIDAEAEGNDASFHQPGFPGALESLVLRPEVKRVLLQAGTGLCAVVGWSGHGSSPEHTLALVDEVCGVAATLDGGSRLAR